MLKKLSLLVVTLMGIYTSGLMQGISAQTRYGDDASEQRQREATEQRQRGFGRGTDTGAYTDNDLRMIGGVLGYDHGYVDGYEQGRRDAAANYEFEYSRHEAYRNADRGLEARFSRDTFQRGYKSGYEKGYADGFYGRDNLVALRFSDLGLGDRADQYRSSGDRTDQYRSSDQPTADRSSDRTYRRSSSGYRTGNTIRLSEGTSIRARINQALSTKTNQRGDRFSAEVIQPVYSGKDIVIPTGSTIRGTLATLHRAGRATGRSEMNLKFESVVLSDGTEEPIVATLTSIDPREKEKVKGGEGTIEGRGSKGRDAAIIGSGAGIGAAIGAIAGGAKGTAIGAGAGGLIGLAGVLATRGKDIELPAGTEVELKLDRPLDLPAYR